MLNLWRRFRASADLDSSQGSGAGRSESCADARAFRMQFEELGKLLRSGTPAARAPSELHAGIMLAVRASQAERAREPGVMWWRWVAGPAFATAVAIMFFSAPASRNNKASGAAETLNSAIATVEQGRDLARRVPAAIMAPLSREWSSVGSDLTSTADFLMASIP